MLLVDIVVVVVVVVLFLQPERWRLVVVYSQPPGFLRRWRETETVFENLFKLALFVLKV